MGQGAVRETLRGAALTILVLGATLLPHMPGRFDAASTTLSVLARVFAVLLLVLVPVGALWLIFGRRRHRLFARVAVMAALIPCIGAGVVAVAASSYSLGILAIVLGGIVLLTDAWPVAARQEDSPVSRVAPISVSLVITPIVIVALQFLLLPRAVEFSRNRAIENAGPLIAEIERHRERTGDYPTSLLSLWPDINTGVVGIDRYRYERRGDAYNLVFENPAVSFGTNEIVVYNPRDEQVFTAHALDLLQNTPEQLRLEWTRGHYAERILSQPHWKYFWFD